MKILFIGTVEFSFRALEKLISMNADVVGVCTKKKSDFNSDFMDISRISAGIPSMYINDINDKESIDWIKALQPDVIFCFGWSSLIGKELLNVAPMGVVGFHPAKLPQNRGRHPLIWALALGLKSSASTFFFMGEGADDGNILSQKEFEILYEDSAKTIYSRVIDIALKQLDILVPELENSTFITKEQNHDQANTWRKRDASDGVIDFRMSSVSIYNLVRALTKPYVGAHIEYSGKNISIWKVEEVECGFENIEPGKVLESNNDGILVKCSNNAIRILEHEFKVRPSIGVYL